MNKTRLLALAAALCAGVALPASAQPAYGHNAPWDRPGGWDRIGSVDFSFRPDRETEYGNFGGRVERLSFLARNGNVRCQNDHGDLSPTAAHSELYRGQLRRAAASSSTCPDRAA